MTRPGAGSNSKLPKRRFRWLNPQNQGPERWQPAAACRLLLNFAAMNSPQLPELPIFRTIAEAAAALQQPAYVVGGYVRDLALGRTSKDIDVVTVGD